MPWECKTVEKLREKFVNAAQSNINFSSLCREFGISRKTGYKWLNRYKESGDVVKKSVSVRIEDTLLEKAKVIAEDGGRSVNGYILYLIRKNVERWEEEQEKGCRFMNDTLLVFVLKIYHSASVAHV